MIRRPPTLYGDYGHYSTVVYKELNLLMLSLVLNQDGSYRFRGLDRQQAEVSDESTSQARTGSYGSGAPSNSSGSESDHQREGRTNLNLESPGQSNVGLLPTMDIRLLRLAHKLKIRIRWPTGGAVVVRDSATGSVPVVVDAVPESPLTAEEKSTLDHGHLVVCVTVDSGSESAPADGDSDSQSTRSAPAVTECRRAVEWQSTVLVNMQDVSIGIHTLVACVATAESVSRRVGVANDSESELEWGTDAHGGSTASFGSRERHESLAAPLCVFRHTQITYTLFDWASERRDAAVLESYQPLRAPDTCHAPQVCVLSIQVYSFESSRTFN